MSEETTNDSGHELDARGLYCPEPMMLLHKKIREIASGEILTLRATDPSTTRDVTKFCHFLGHELLTSTERDDELVFTIRKAAD